MMRVRFRGVSGRHSQRPDFEPGFSGLNVDGHPDIDAGHVQQHVPVGRYLCRGKKAFRRPLCIELARGHSQTPMPTEHIERPIVPREP
jgi:hypothetical protein